MKIKVNSLLEIDNLLKGLLRFTEGCRLVIDKDKTNIYLGNSSQTVRLFITTNSMQLEDGQTPEQIAEINFRELNKFIQALQLLKDYDVENNAGTIYFDINNKGGGEYLSYRGPVQFNLKLDRREATDIFVTSALRDPTAIVNVFTWQMETKNIEMLSKYSKFNTNVPVNVYFHLGDNDTLYADIDNKKIAMLSSVSLPITNVYDGTLSEPVCADLEHVRQWNIIGAEEGIRVGFTNKNCFKIEGMRYSDSGVYTKMLMITAKLKN